MSAQEGEKSSATAALGRFLPCSLTSVSRNKGHFSPHHPYFFKTSGLKCKTPSVFDNPFRFCLLSVLLDEKEHTGEWGQGESRTKLVFDWSLCSLQLHRGSLLSLCPQITPHFPCQYLHKEWRRNFVIPPVGLFQDD
jgi:hypothetical protein